MKNPKTTAFGIVAILAAVFGALAASLDNDPATQPDWTAVVAAITAGLGLIFAKDAQPKP